MHSSAALGVGRLTNSDHGRAGTPWRAKWRRGAALLLFALAGCSSPGAYTWVQNFPVTPVRSDLVSPGDMLAVRVFGQETMSSTSRVRADGAVMLPLVGELLVAGKAPAALATELEERLKPYVQAPRVTITIESSPVRVTVLGEVRTPGTTSLERPATIVQALADRGGITEFASDDRLFVLRGQARVRFTYEQLTRGDGAARSFTLLPGDVVVVE